MAALGIGEDAERIVALPGMDEDLLVQLARYSPTLIQLQLLRSASAVRAFLSAPRAAGAAADNGAGANGIVVAAEDPITLMYRMAAPQQPVFQWLQMATGPGPAKFRCEYRLGDAVGTGAGGTKKVAKMAAAADLLSRLRAGADAC